MRAVTNLIGSLPTMQLLKNLLCRFTLHSHGRSLCFFLNVRFKPSQIKNSDQFFTDVYLEVPARAQLSISEVERPSNV